MKQEGQSPYAGTVFGQAEEDEQLLTARPSPSATAAPMAGLVPAAVGALQKGQLGSLALT
jgi:hypothetical protein